MTEHMTPGRGELSMMERVLYEIKKVIVGQDHLLDDFADERLNRDCTG